MKFRPHRTACLYKTQLGIQSTRAKVIVRDVSDAGANVEIGASNLIPGDQIKLWVMEKPLIATVRWIKGVEIGVKFERNLTPRELAVLRHGSLGPGQRGPQLRKVFHFAEL